MLNYKRTARDGTDGTETHKWYTSHVEGTWDGARAHHGSSTRAYSAMPNWLR